MESGSHESEALDINSNSIQAGEHEVMETNSTVASTSDTNTSDEDKMNEDELKLWSAVKENPSDFSSWTTLLQLVEQKNKLSIARDVFNAFLKVYPYCYGYWKKFADLEKRLSSAETAKEVYEHGVQAVSLSVDLWIHYVNFTAGEDPEGKEAIRSLYQRAVSTCGLDYRSTKLWDQYIAWEKDNGSPQQVLEVYDQVLPLPLLQHQQYYDSFKQFVESKAVAELLGNEELSKLQSETEEEGDAAEKALKEKIINKRTSSFEKCKVEVEKRATFEDGIKRPYFHVKPLERVQLRNWKDYLDFEIAEGNEKRILVLFERCVIACALYEDFWTKFGKYAEAHCPNTARSVYMRACTIHLPKKPNIHVLWAAFEEKQGNVEKARDILRSIDSLVPGLVFIRQRRIGLEIRQKRYKEAQQLYQESIASADSAEMRNFFAWRYARFLVKVEGDQDSASRILQEAIDKDKLNSTLYFQLLDLKTSCYPLDEESIEKVFQQVQDSELEEEIKHTFSLRRSQFLEEFGSNISKILQAQKECQSLKKSLKRKASSAQLPSDTDNEATKRAKLDSTTCTSTTTPVMSSAVTTPTQATPTPEQQQQQQQQQWAAYQQQWGAYNYGQQGYNYQSYYPQYPATQYGQTQ